jgi:hypothetical protein
VTASLPAQAARRVLAGALAVLLLAGCSGDGGASADPVARPSPSPSPSASPTPSVSPPPTPGERFSAEVEELYALVKPSVEGSGDLAASNQVLDAFATTVALVRVPPELTATRQEVVDAAEAAAESYGTAAGITGAVERAAAVRHAVVRLRELERVIRTLPA